MITTKQGKPVIQKECWKCKEPACGLGERHCLVCGNVGNGTGHIYTEIPDKYIEEVERLLKVEKPDSDNEKY